MSGYPLATLVRDGKLAGGEPFLHKPFSPAGFVQKVRDTLGP